MTEEITIRLHCEKKEDSSEPSEVVSILFGVVRSILDILETAQDSDPNLCVDYNITHRH